MAHDDLYVRQHSRYFMAAGMAVLLLFSLLMYVLSWTIGGNDHLESMGGKTGLGLVAVFLVISMAAAALTRPKD